MTEILKPDKSGETNPPVVNIARRTAFVWAGNGCWSEKGRESVNGVRLPTSYGIEAHFPEKGFLTFSSGKIQRKFAIKISLS